ncbi:hypothetical protein SLE2022_002620 [Rubroshorea leprosula]
MASSKEPTEGKKISSSTAGEGTKATKTLDKTTGTPKKLKRKTDKKNNRSRNGMVDKSEVPTYPSSSTESEESEPDGEEERGGKAKNQCGENPHPKKRKQKGGEDEDEEQKEEAKMYRFSMNRIKTMIKSGDCEKGITQDAIFLVNKATEKFLEQFCDDSYWFAAKDRKKSLAYKHLSSVVSKWKRLDFLSDFVPEKVKAGDALEGMKLFETQLG